MSLTPKTIGQLNPIDQVTATTLFLAEKNGTTVHVPYSEIAGVNYTELTYAELTGLISVAGLVPATFYMITDFQTCYDQPNFDWNGDSINNENTYKVGNIESLMVLALAADRISTTAYSPEYPSDKIQYDINWNQTEFTNSGAKGRITERIDQNNNRADYDFRNVQFIRYDALVADTYYEGNVSVGNPFFVYDPETQEQLSGPDGFIQHATVTGVDTTFTNDFYVGDYLAVSNTNTIGCHNFYEVVGIENDTTMTVAGIYYSNEYQVSYSKGSTMGNLSPFKPNVTTLRGNSEQFYTFDADSRNTYLGDNKDYDTFILSNNVFLDGDYNDNYFGANVQNNTFDDDMNGNTADINFQNNIINDDFDRNKIGRSFRNNLIVCDMSRNQIGDSFEYNTLADNDGYDFNDNVIQHDFRHNFITMYNDNFNENIIANDFSDNIIDDGFARNIIGDGFANNICEDTFENNKIGNSFSNNKITNNFEDNSIGNSCGGNILDGATNNTIGNNFQNNTIGYDFRFNTIGHNFTNNMIESDFGFGYGESRGNVIGNFFTGNIIGEYFYSNHIADNFGNNNIGHWFQNNKVDVVGLSGVNFKEKLNSIATVSTNIAEVTYTDGVYNVYQTANYSNNEGIGAQFTITVSGGSITNIEVTNGGSLYGTYNIIGISGDQIPGSTQELTLVVNTLTTIPLVYETINSTISRGFDAIEGNVPMISLLSMSPGGNGVYISKDYKGPFGLVEDENNGGGGNTGSGSWYFYTAEGAFTVGPPTSDGQAIFTDNNSGSGTLSTFNPNNNTGIDYLNFCLKDSAGTDYTTQFTTLQTNGGTISVTQNGNTATYTLMPNMAYVNAGPGFVSINTTAATQTVTTASPFVYGDPISISFS